MALEDEQNHEQSNSIQTIPTLLLEIVIEILLKLRVKSLLRCKSVCKLWCSLISDPYFVKSHLTLSTSNTHYASNQLIFSTGLPINNLKTCSVYDTLNDKSANVLDLDYPLKNTGKSVSIVGSCNGLLCIVVDDVMFIWNPSTRRSNMLPPCCSSRSSSTMLHGFGYDEPNDDYKAVRMCRSNKDGGKGNTIVNIYSMKTGQWKNIGDFGHRVNPLDKYGKYSNGALHWAATRGFGSSYSWTIVSLDLAKETYGEISQAVYDTGNHDLMLGVLGGCLCVVCSYYGNRADIWVMKAYGVKDSWTKSVSIPYPPDTWRNTFSVPLCISNDGEVLLKFGQKLVVYDSTKTSFSEIKKVEECLGVYTFVDSLVSPYALAGLEDNNDDGNCGNL